MGELPVTRPLPGSSITSSAHLVEPRKYIRTEQRQRDKAARGKRKRGRRVTKRPPSFLPRRSGSRPESSLPATVHLRWLRYDTDKVSTRPVGVKKRWRRWELSTVLNHPISARNRTAEWTFYPADLRLQGRSGNRSRRRLRPEPQPAWKMPRLCSSRSGALLLALLLQASMEVRGWCLESSQCQDLSTESNLLACIRACKPDLSAETPVFPGNGDAQPLTENPRKYVMGHFRWDRFGRRNGSSSGGGGGGGGAGQKREEEEVAAGEGPGPRGDGVAPGPRQDKRSYSMEHFRWGKPVGKKRRPVKVYPNGAEDELAEAFPLEFRRELAGAPPEPARDPEAPAEGAAARAELEYGLVAEAEAAEKKDEGPYKMEHFRWGSPPKDKRYGGFMTSEKSQTPLVTLFKNAIVKNAHKKGQ
uniref:Pro-opiomelanocortin n=1 Tax=Sus scrofa TaxID=9823 RepID=A0A4X1TXQ0_PIG